MSAALAPLEVSTVDEIVRLIALIKEFVDAQAEAIHEIQRLQEDLHLASMSADEFKRLFEEKCKEVEMYREQYQASRLEVAELQEKIKQMRDPVDYRGTETQAVCEKCQTVVDCSTGRSPCAFGRK